MTKQEMARVRDRDVRHYPIKNGGALRYSAIPTLADAILDRVVHNAYRIELAGESLRKRPSSS